MIEGTIKMLDTLREVSDHINHAFEEIDCWDGINADDAEMEVRLAISGLQDVLDWITVVQAADGNTG